MSDKPLVDRLREAAKSDGYMSIKEWRKVSALLTEAAAVLESGPFFHGYQIIVDNNVPPREIRFVDKNGRTVGKIIDVTY